MSLSLISQLYFVNAGEEVSEGDEVKEMDTEEVGKDATRSGSEDLQYRLVEKRMKTRKDEVVPVSRNASGLEGELEPAMGQASNGKLGEQDRKKGVSTRRRPSMLNWTHRKRRRQPKNGGSNKRSIFKRQRMTKPCENTVKLEGDDTLDPNPMESQDESDPLKISKKSSSLLGSKEEAEVCRQLLLKCPFCFLIYAKRADLIKHLSVHGKKTDYKPKSRGKVVRSSGGGERVAGNGTAPCNTCGKSFSSKQALTVHMKLHEPHPTRPWNCSQCSLYFTSLNRLGSHLCIPGKNLKTSEGQIPPQEAEIIKNVGVAKAVERDNSVVANYGSENSLVTATSGGKEQEGFRSASNQACDSPSVGSSDLRNETEVNLTQYTNYVKGIGDDGEGESDINPKPVSNDNECSGLKLPKINEADGHPIFAGETEMETLKILDGVHEKDDNQFKSSVTTYTPEQSPELRCVSANSNSSKSPEIISNLPNIASNIDPTIANLHTGSAKVIHTPNLEVEIHRKKSIEGLVGKNKRKKPSKLPSNRIQTNQRRSSPRFNPHNVFNVSNLEITEHQNPEGSKYNRNKKHAGVLDQKTDKKKSALSSGDAKGKSGILGSEVVGSLDGNVKQSYSTATCTDSNALPSVQHNWPSSSKGMIISLPHENWDEAGEEKSISNSIVGHVEEETSEVVAPRNDIEEEMPHQEVTTRATSYQVKSISKGSNTTGTDPPGPFCENNPIEKDPIVPAPGEPSYEPVYRNRDKLSSCSPYKPETEVIENIKELVSKRREIPITDKVPPTSSENEHIGQDKVTSGTTEPPSSKNEPELSTPDMPSASSPDNSQSGQGPKTDQIVQVLFKCPFCFAVFAEGDDLIKHLPTHSKDNTRKENVEIIPYEGKSVESGLIPTENVEVENLEDETGVEVKVGSLQGAREAHKSSSVDSLERDSGTCEVAMEETNDEVVQPTSLNEVCRTRPAIEGDCEGNSKLVSNDMESCIDESLKQKQDGKSVSNDIAILQINPELDQDNPIQSANVNEEECQLSVDEDYEEDDLFIPVSRKELKSLQNGNGDNNGTRTLIIPEGGVMEQDNDWIQNWLKAVEPSDTIPLPDATTEIDVDSTCTCDICGKKLSSVTSKLVHTRIHTGERPYKCQQCTQSFRQDSNLRSHMKFHDNSRAWKCSQCSLRFLSKPNLQIHFRRHKKEKDGSKRKGSSHSETFEKRACTASHSQNPFKCAKCGASFKQMSSLTNHVRTLHDRTRPWKCCLCDFYFPTKGNLQRHERFKHKKIGKGNPRFMAVKNGERKVSLTPKHQDHQDLSLPKSISSWTGVLKKVIKIILPKDDPVVREYLQNHMELKQEKVKEFEKTSELLEAEDRIHSPSLPRSQLQLSQMDQLTPCSVVLSKCDKLGDSYKQARAISASGSNNVAPLEMTGIGKRISGLEARKKMLVQMLEEDFQEDDHAHDIKDNEPSIPTEGAKLLEKESTTKPKPTTGRKAGRPSIIVGYQKMKTFSCTVCSEILCSLESAKSHLLTHTEEKVYKCPTCSKDFRNKHSLKRHILSHAEARPYKCQMCSKRFKFKAHLKQHIPTHTTERPYKCPTCLRAFRTALNLKQHIGTHSSEKPHKCPTCLREFKRTANLKRHIRTHSSEKAHKCPTCFKTFREKVFLKNHIRTHSGERPYKCPHCVKRFTSPSNRYNHVKKVHKAAK